MRAWWEVPSEAIVYGSSHTSPEQFHRQTMEGSAGFPSQREESTPPSTVICISSWIGRTTGAQSWELYRVYREQIGGIVRNPEYYFLPGITWSARPWLRGAFSVVPGGVIFSHTGMMLFLPQKDLWSICALLNSDAFIGLLHLLMARGGGSETDQTLKYEIGYVSAVPIPGMSGGEREEFGILGEGEFQALLAS